MNLSKLFVSYYFDNLREFFTKAFFDYDWLRSLNDNVTEEAYN